MKFSFTIYFNDDLKNFISADNCKELKVQECVSSMTVEGETLEEAVTLVQATLAADSKTLVSLVLKLIEV